MTSITAVKMAMRRGEHGDARYLVRKLLNTDPTAEAFYMAAKLETRPETAMIYVNKALELKPDYEAAILFKQVLERIMPSDTGKLRQEVLHEMETSEMFVPKPSTPLERFARIIAGSA